MTRDLDRFFRVNLWMVLLILFLAPSTRAQVPHLLNYQGRVQVGTNDFHGVGQFRFSLVNRSGTVTYWSNDQSASDGQPPAKSVSLPVTRGLYSVQLGNTDLPGMSPLPATVFTNSDIHLRVWFDDGQNGSQLFAPDQRIAAVGFAMMAASVPDGSITSAKLAPGAVSALGTPDGSATSVLQVNGAGNVGIGVINPAAKLDISGSLRAGTLSLDSGSPQVTFKSQTAPNQTGFVESGLAQQSFSSAFGIGLTRFTSPRFSFGYQTEPGQNKTPVFGFSDSGYVGSLRPDGSYRNLLDNSSGGMIIQSDADIGGRLILRGDALISGSSITASNALFKTNVTILGNLEVAGSFPRSDGAAVASEAPSDGIGITPPFVRLQKGQYEHCSQRVIETPIPGFLVILADVHAWVENNELVKLDLQRSESAMFEIFDETGNRTLATTHFTWPPGPFPQHSLRAVLPVPAGRRVISTKVKACDFQLPGSGPYETVFLPKMATLIIMFFPKDMGVGF